MPENKTFAEQLREMFPNARMVCYCHRDCGECPADCTNMQKAREDIRAWGGSVDEQAV